MSNTRKATQKTYSLDKYRKDATKAPFPLEVSEDRTIFIGRPTAETMLDVAEKFSEADASNIREILRALLGDKHDEVMELIKDEDFGVMMALVADLGEYFEMGEALGSLAS